MRTEHLDKVVIRFAGDSGDGMQLLGARFTAETAQYGNDLATLPSYPAEIRAPQGTVPGVSSFQIHFADTEITTPGDHVDVLVAMNPAALKANVAGLRRGGLIIADSDEFTQRNIAKVGYESNPLTDDSLASFQVVPVKLTSLSVGSVAQLGLGRKDANLTKNMFALGVISWLYSRPTEPTESYLNQRSYSNPAMKEANIVAFKAGYAYGETSEAFTVRYEVAPAQMAPGRYRHINGNRAVAYGLMVGAHLAHLPLFLGSYPITPASDILHELAKRKGYNVTTFQAEDEIAGVGSALGASYAGCLGVTTTSGPGLSLKMESIGLGVMLELPLVVVDIQRSGPSTGLPTKTEQADLMQAIWGRHGESPVVVLAPQSPSDCFDTAVEACRIAVTYRTPVLLLSDAYLANGAEPWHVPDIASMTPIDPHMVVAAPEGGYLPYARDPETLARAWALPGTPGLEHRIGGIEKSETGDISYDPENHDAMVRIRAEKLHRVTQMVPDIVVDDPSGKASALILGWGSTFGHIAATAQIMRREGIEIATAHLRYLNPMPANLGDILASYDKVIIPEMNLGQLASLIRDRYLKPVTSITQITGLPFASGTLVDDIKDVLSAQEHTA